MSRKKPKEAMSPDEDIYDLDLDLDEQVDDDPDAVMQEAMASIEARQEEASGEIKRGSVARDDSSVDLPSEIGSTDKVKQMEEEIVALRERSLRALADLENYRRRSEKERDELMRYAGFEMLREFLDVVDNLERALGSQGSLEDLTQGVQMIHRQLLDVLRRFGVERVESKGEAFDPAVHEAVAKVEDSTVKEATVIDEMQSGFVMHDRLLRPAIVRVAMPTEAPDSAEDATETEEEAEGEGQIEKGPVVIDDPGTEIGGEKD